jgi:hypothetical protein
MYRSSAKVKSTTNQLLHRESRVRFTLILGYELCSFLKALWWLKCRTSIKWFSIIWICVIVDSSRSCSFITKTLLTIICSIFFYLFLDHVMLYRVHLAWAGCELTTLVVIGTDCICSCKSNYYMITTTTAPCNFKDDGLRWLNVEWI